MRRLLICAALLVAFEARAACSLHYQPGNHPTLTVARYYSCDTFAEVPAGSNQGDLAWATDTAEFYVWSGGVWESTSGTGGGAAWGDITGTLGDQTDLGTALSGKAPTTRTIATTAPLAGGGDLSGDRTLTVSIFNSGATGIVPASGGGTTNFLRADATWAAPSGGPGGGVNVVSVDVDFGTGNTTASAVVTGETWVTTTSKIVCNPTLLGTSGRAEGSEDAIIEGLVAAFHSRVAGTGFTVVASPRLGLALGVYTLQCLGG